MKCQSGKFAEKLGDPPGSDCSREAVEGLSFCLECARRVESRLLAGKLPGAEKRLLLVAIIGVLGGELLKNWDAVAAILKAAYVATTGNRFDGTMLIPAGSVDDLLREPEQVLVVRQEGEPDMRISLIGDSSAAIVSAGFEIGHRLLNTRASDSPDPPPKSTPSPADE